MSNVIQFPKKIKRQTKEKKQSHQPPSNKKKATKPIALVATSSSVCLMLLGVPVVSYFWQAPENDRGLATPCVESMTCGDHVTSECCNRVSNCQWHDNTCHSNQDKQILYLLKNRRLASIGQQPNDKDNFLITELESKYEIKWKRSNRDQLESAILIEEYEPIRIPEIPALIKKYPTIFPKYSTMSLSPFSSNDLESYELQSEDGVTTGIIEIMKDNQGRALSIYVQ